MTTYVSTSTHSQPENKTACILCTAVLVQAGVGYTLADIVSRGEGLEHLHTYTTAQPDPLEHTHKPPPKEPLLSTSSASHDSSYDAPHTPTPPSTQQQQLHTPTLPMHIDTGLFIAMTPALYTSTSPSTASFWNTSISEAYLKAHQAHGDVDGAVNMDMDCGLYVQMPYGTVVRVDLPADALVFFLYVSCCPAHGESLL